MIKGSSYIKRISATFEEIVKGKVFVGRDNSHLTAKQKHYLARLFNSFGFSFGRWNRYLKKPVYPSRLIISGEVHATNPSIDSEEINEILKIIRTRNHPRKPEYICVMKKDGGCSKSFPNENKLASWIAEQYPKDWRNQFITTAKETPPKKPTSFIIAAFEKQFSDLSSQYTISKLKIGIDDYVLFDVPADNQCLFHSLEGVLKPLYTATAAPSFKEIRKAVISFYQTIPDPLRVFLEEE